MASLFDDASPVEKATDGPRRRRPKLGYGRNEHDDPLTAEEFVIRLDDLVTEEQNARSDWMENRLQRYAKLRGWLQTKDWPWTDCSNQHIPIMMANCLRTEAGLYNAVLGQRPVMSAKPVRKDRAEAADIATNLTDYQFFVEQSGDQLIEQYITQFVEDGTVVTFQPWVKEKHPFVDVRVIPPPPPEMDLGPYLLDVLPTLVPSLQGVTMDTTDGKSWHGTIPTEGGDQRIDIEVYDTEDPDDDDIAIELRWNATTHNGPVMIVHQLEDIVVPMRAENCQPVTGANPGGAPWVARMLRVDIDTLKRRKRDGVFDLLTDEDIDDLMELAGTRIPRESDASDEDVLRRKRDEVEGRQDAMGADHGSSMWLTLVEVYKAWDANDDGYDEECVATYVKEGLKLCRARYLTESYPGLPLRRPFGEARFIPVPGQFYGIGQPELMEGLHEFLHILVNQNVDGGTLGTAPFGFYRPSSGLKPETMRFWPGELYPLDNPQQDVVFPMLPSRDQSWNFNMIGLGMQFMEKLVQISPLQLGQVPQGKASALRTAATTQAILQQGAAMPEQILRRLFMGLKQVWEQFHLLNLRYLPRKKEFLVHGKPQDQDEAYGVVKDPTDLDGVQAFDFGATLLNTNKGMMAQALQGIGAAVINPLMLQLGMVKPENVYNWANDFIKAAQLDSQRYLSKPADTPQGPRHTAEEAMVMIIDGVMPEVAPVEEPQAHLQRFQSLLQSPDAALLSPASQAIAQMYLRNLVQLVQQAQQQQQMMQAAQQFSEMMGQHGGNGPGAPPGMGAPPEPQTEQGTQDELAGAMKSGGGPMGG